jgi:hypothetical protein
LWLQRRAQQQQQLNPPPPVMMVVAPPPPGFIPPLPSKIFVKIPLFGVKLILLPQLFGSPDWVQTLSGEVGRRTKTIFSSQFLHLLFMTEYLALESAVEVCASTLETVRKILRENSRSGFVIVTLAFASGSGEQKVLDRKHRQHLMICTYL